MILTNYALDSHPCTIETFPTIDSTQTLVCGTYELKDEGKVTEYRTGTISLINISIQSPSDHDKVAVSQIDILSQLNYEPSGGVLDMKTIDDGHVITAMSCGSVHVFDTQLHMNLQQKTTFNQPNEGLALSVDVSNSTSFTEGSFICTSTQSGSIFVYETKKSGISQLLHLQEAHMFSSQPMPVWIVAMNEHCNSQIVSGGDDCKLKVTEGSTAIS